tara:strand:- start:83 stop:739 length:657 start_codon:yes stop_codon:yes gene_type:complete
MKSQYHAHITTVDKLMSQELEYFERQYPEDLEHVFDLLGANMSLLIFTNSRHPPHVKEWTEHFTLIERKVDFLFCLFFHVLIDQALHFTGQSGNLKFETDKSGYLDQPKLRGILATAHSNVSPFFLLVSATLWMEAGIDADGKLVAYSRLFRLLCEDLCIPFDFLSTQAVAREAGAFATGYEGFANATYFRRQTPDLQLLQSWGSLLNKEFGAETTSA